MQPEWLPPRKIRNLVDYAFGDAWQAEKALYLAVIKGEVRARLNGRVLGPEWLKQVEKLVHDPNDPFALPPDLELSVEDVQKMWHVG